jgi:putative FmdB family regulatory protein
MTFYSFECEECEVYWEKEGSMSKPPKTSKCSICNKRRNRVFTAPSLHFKGMDFHTNRVKVEKYKRDGMEKEVADEFLKNECKYSKDRASESARQYKRVVPDFEKMVKEGKARKCSDKETAQRKKNARQITTDWYNRAGMDPHKDITPNLNSIY